jgi:hypothetical protein
MSSSWPNVSNIRVVNDDGFTINDGLIGHTSGLALDSGVHRRLRHLVRPHLARRGQFLGTLISHARALFPLARAPLPHVVAMVGANQWVSAVSRLRRSSTALSPRLLAVRAVHLAVVIAPAQIKHDAANPASLLTKAVVHGVCSCNAVLKTCVSANAAAGSCPST